ncbi:FecR family protein [Bacteroidota bacterium]
MKKEQKHIDESLLLKLIENRADEQEMSLFNSWLETSAENAEIFEELKKTNQLINIDNQSLQKNWESVVQKVKSGNKVPEYIELPDSKIRAFNFRNNNLIRIAAMLIILLGVSFLLKNIVFNPEQLISGKDLNPNEPYQLADGSLVYLNGNSEISFSKHFGEKNRNISLKGEAFFEVKRNENIPFRITTYKTTTQVLGTSFNVYSDQSEQVRVSVVTGVVEFSSRKKKNVVKLEAGEQGIYSPNLSGVKKEIINDPNFMAWKTGILYFNETPIQEAIHLIQKQYSRVMIFEDNKNEMPTLTTTFDNQPLEAVLEELNLLLNTKHEILNDTIFFTQNN